MQPRDWHDEDGGAPFEQVFPAYEFSELVRLAILLAKLWVRVTRNSRLPSEGTRPALSGTGSSDVMAKEASV